MSNKEKICFYTEPGDTNSFGSSVAINDNYLAVGDPRANRVVIYQSDFKDQWERSFIIYPPEGSPAYKIGNGFGRNLTLYRSTLIINARTQKITKRINIYYPEPIFFEDYIVELEKEKLAISIDVPIEKYEPLDIKARKNHASLQFHVLYEEKLKIVTLPDNNEEYFGASIAAHNNLVLVGSPSRYLGGKGWLFDLNKLNENPSELTTKNAHLGDTVAVSDQFAVVGNRGTKSFIEDDISYLKTLIKSLKSGSTVVIDCQGYLSLDRNILAIMLPASRRLMQSSELQVFYLEEDAAPRLIYEQKSSKDAWHFKGKYLIRAWVQNGWLITIHSINQKGQIKLCLKSIEQIIDN